LVRIASLKILYLLVPIRADLTGYSIVCAGLIQPKSFDLARI